MALLIGIDTGVHTGFAVWDTKAQSFREIATLKIHEALIKAYEYTKTDRVEVYFEDARKRTWIPREASLRERVGRAQGAGSVKRDATIWEDFLNGYGIPMHKVAPKNNVTKMNEDYFKALTKWTKRTSEHGRDAAMLVFGR